MFSDEHTNVREGNGELSNYNPYEFRPDDYSLIHFLLISMKHGLSLMNLICFYL